jgi:hypothetical protein
MNGTFENDVATIIYDNPCYFDKSYDNPLFIPTIDTHDNEEVRLENLYDNPLDDSPMLLDVINYNATKNRIAIMCPIPFKSDQSSCFAITESEKEDVFIFILIPLFWSLIWTVCLQIMKNMLCVIFILLSLFMMLLKIIMREENMVVGIFMLLKHLSLY